ncbi:hypothetical protein GCM10010365_28030 [Streptomyces poonensis]|uniref:Uncharacterized protein n=1 Tax=Streptomyces poonensis TaxID=68255 RepID=A0A918PG76_9ACTN|nr:hypothetical protein GCM10010365_28030 [Streptomyces poonensis]GLJ88570.1 hypothetical protein GCM10017589_11700 [Streptomyces poonensis]
MAKAWRRASDLVRLSEAGDGFGDEAMKVLPGVRRLSALRLPTEGARGQGSPEWRNPVRGVHEPDGRSCALDMRFTPTATWNGAGHGRPVGPAPYREPVRVRFRAASESLWTSPWSSLWRKGGLHRWPHPAADG